MKMKSIMKKILFVSLLCLFAVTVGAQSLDDALNYGDKNYYGTARSAALGNAMTAVGGDLGSIGINPAGAAVAGYSQFTITPGLSISSTNASYAPAIGDKVQTSLPDSHTHFIMPNFGFIMNVDTRRDYGLKNWTFGMTINTTNVFNERITAEGVTDQSSMMGAIANSSYDIPNADLFSGDGYDPYRNGALYGKWGSILAYQAFMINQHPFEKDGFYLGSSESIYEDGSIDVLGPINQSYFRQRIGSKSDAVINLAFNWNDRFYFGGNIGITSLSYTEHLNRYEEARDPAQYAWYFNPEDETEKSYWQNARDRYTLETNGTGIYAKLGFIWLPVDGLRLGGAIQTPTGFSITERCEMDAVCNFTGYNPKPNGDNTPLDEYTYQLTTPFSFNLGAAYTLGNRALLSADWERSDFRTMRFGDSDYQSEWSAYNKDVRDYAGVTHHLRLGAEYRVTDAFALRAGYSFKQYAEKQPRPYYSERIVQLTHTGSLGFGYSSPGSFFLDCAVRYAMAPNSWYYPYDSYEIYRSGEWKTVDPPEIGISKRLMDVILTLGWRF